jgi:uncharacterized repeat protein (TIGR01451 family)
MPILRSLPVTTLRRLSLAVATSAALVAAASPASAAPSSAVANPDLTVTVSGSPNSVPAGSDVTYTIRVRNTGAGPAVGVVLTDKFPGAVYQSSTVNPAAAGSCSPPAGTLLTCALGNMNAGELDTVTVTVTPKAVVAGTSITNTATVAPPDGGNPNVNTETTAVTGSTADLAVQDITLPPSIRQGPNPVTFNVKVANQSGDPASNSVLTLTVPVPANFQITSAGRPADTCNTTATGQRCELATLAANGTVSIPFTMTVAPAAVGSNVTFTASVTSDATDATPGNNTATQAVTVT